MENIENKIKRVEQGLERSRYLIQKGRVGVVIIGEQRKASTVEYAVIGTMDYVGDVRSRKGYGEVLALPLQFEGEERTYVAVDDLPLKFREVASKIVGITE